MIGVGGIGSGSFFELRGDHTLGREESRSGRFLPHRDYCKLHIVSHYVNALLGPSFETILIGKVGEDNVGARILNEMDSAGLDIRHVESIAGESTLFSFCFLYPDGTGGNLTVDDSACDKVNAAFVAQAIPEFRRLAGKGIALSVPEVPLAARKKLLQLATQYMFYRVASFVSGEIHAACEMGLLEMVDLLSINTDEAAAIAGLSLGERQMDEIIESAILELKNHNPDIKVCITAGGRGSWCWDTQSITHLPAFEIQAVGTAGAGDAYLAGVIAGEVVGLPLSIAQEIATLTSAMAVTSPHSINPEISWGTLLEFARRNAFSLSDHALSLLSESRSYKQQEGFI